MKYKYLILSTIFCYLLRYDNISAQNQQEMEVSKFISSIDTIYKDDFLLNNGRLYIYETPRALGFPFYLSENWYVGDLILETKEYKNHNLKYDICNNKIICIIKGPNNEQIPIVLNNDIITGFRIENHRFIQSKLIEALPNNGFYEILYQGNEIQAYASWKKDFLRIYTKENLGEFDQQEKSIYMLVNEKAIPIKSTKEFIALFGENKKQVKSYIKKHRIKILKSENIILSQLFKFCEDVIANSNQKQLK